MRTNRNVQAQAFSIGSFVLANGQKFRADEAPTRTAITVRYLAQREADRLARRASYGRRAK